MVFLMLAVAFFYCLVIIIVLIILFPKVVKENPSYTMKVIIIEWN